MELIKVNSQTLLVQFLLWFITEIALTLKNHYTNGFVGSYMLHSL